MITKTILALGLWLGLVSSKVATASTESCDVALAKLFLNPPRTYLEFADEGLYSPLLWTRFMELANEHRAMSAELRPHGTKDHREIIYHLANRKMGPDDFWIRTNLIMEYTEEKIVYDQKTGEVGKGFLSAEVLTPVAVRLQFTIWEDPDLTKYHFRRVHDHVVPQIQTELDRLNLEAKAKFGRAPLGPLEQKYPGDYEPALASDITAEELGFFITALAAKTQ